MRHCISCEGGVKDFLPHRKTRVKGSVIVQNILGIKCGEIVPGFLAQRHGNILGVQAAFRLQGVKASDVGKQALADGIAGRVVTGNVAVGGVVDLEVGDS